MKISENEYSEIRVVGSDNELIASITDTNIIVLDGYKVVCVSMMINLNCYFLYCLDWKQVYLHH